MVAPLVLAAGIAGGAGIASSLISHHGQSQANKANIASARESMDFQERMSNTAYERAMQDMGRAGLNPILAAKQPASTPAGAQSKSENAKAAYPSAIANSAQNYFQLQALNMAKTKNEAEVALLQSQADLTRTNALHQFYKLDRAQQMSAIDKTVFGKSFANPARYGLDLLKGVKDVKSITK